MGSKKDMLLEIAKGGHGAGRVLSVAGPNDRIRGYWMEGRSLWRSRDAHGEHLFGEMDELFDEPSAWIAALMNPSAQKGDFELLEAAGCRFECASPGPVAAFALMGSKGAIEFAAGRDWGCAPGAQRTAKFGEAWERLSRKGKHGESGGRIAERMERIWSLGLSAAPQLGHAEGAFEMLLRSGAWNCAAEAGEKWRPALLAAWPSRGDRWLGAARHAALGASEAWGAGELESLYECEGFGGCGDAPGKLGAFFNAAGAKALSTDLESAIERFDWAAAEFWVACAGGLMGMEEDAMVCFADALEGKGGRPLRKNFSAKALFGALSQKGAKAGPKDSAALRICRLLLDNGARAAPAIDRLRAMRRAGAERMGGRKASGMLGLIEAQAFLELSELEPVLSLAERSWQREQIEQSAGPGMKDRGPGRSL